MKRLGTFCRRVGYSVAGRNRHAGRICWFDWRELGRASTRLFSSTIRPCGGWAKMRIKPGGNRSRTPVREVVAT